MTGLLWIYLAAWMVACLAAIAVFWRRRRAFAVSHATYWRFLFVPWKVITFAIAALGITLIAPYTGDPTWDHFDAAFMSVLTYLTAPWAVGAIYLSLRGRLPAFQAYAAACAWLFSASWSYDLYLLLRDGHYPGTWLPNLFASSVLYVAAGLLWNLDWRAGKGVVFAFTEPGWPAPPEAGAFRRIVWYALPFMIIAAVAILSFVWPS
ncbi:MAG TPA: hypothetical protein VNK67_00115 [Burkholderiales bacterium]|nr:hypothetical protein [Burkholderiales bacterium]